MNIIELAKYLLDEEAAEEYLLHKGILKNFKECPYCRSTSFGKIRRGRIKCYKCKKEWHRRKGSILESRHVSFSVYIGLLKLFSYDFSVNKISQELALDYKSVVELTDALKSHLIRKYSAPDLVGSKQFLLFESLSEQKIEVKIWSEENVRDLLAQSISFGVLKLNRTKAYDDVLSFIFVFHWIFKLKRRKVYNIDRFLKLFKEKLSLYRGVSYEKFSEYFLESLIRYNMVDQDYFQIILESIKIEKSA